MKFSERYGYTEIRVNLQREQINDALRIGLWNVLQKTYWSLTKYKNEYGHWDDTNNLALLGRLNGIGLVLWEDYFKIPTDTMPRLVNQLLPQIRARYFDYEWYQVYNFIEFIASCEKKYSGDWSDQNQFYRFSRSFIQLCNEILKRELSAYRFVGEDIIEITSDEEIKEIEEVLHLTGRFESVRAHLQTSLQLLSDRKSPDYRNSIKEAISSVEALSRIISDDPNATLGQALKTIEKRGQIHGALKKSFTALYGYTSDADGIRHAMLDEPDLGPEDAKLMLVSCSAFTNYMIAKLQD